MQSTFDPVGVATDWLDAYRAKNVGAIVALYADDALIECRCDGQKTIAGGAALTAYWETRCVENTRVGFGRVAATGWRCGRQLSD
jgi:ketosteroid isomerase-like protein